MKIYFSICQFLASIYIKSKFVLPHGLEKGEFLQMLVPKGYTKAANFDLDLPSLHLQRLAPK
jgi:predicted cupin superfamily sugar epimerase